MDCGACSDLTVLGVLFGVRFPDREDLVSSSSLSAL